MAYYSLSWICIVKRRVKFKFCDFKNRNLPLLQILKSHSLARIDY
ncbi:hypothetical protein UNSW3_933 [Campylobacter concisus UNSW3]|uniref:Uncharacterized protein n=1 Tax=Campylobacter concisus UNSW3 TaxID=1242966 RepID=U2GC50_9BACT|nr:hypothetical protein UNSW3_933 [Campylobacter concisus UNSW3]